MRRAKLRLLLLSVGGGVVQNIIDALGNRRERCVLIGTNSIVRAASSFRCDTVHLVPPAASGAEYMGRIDELIREERPDIVIPCRDDDVLALATLGEQSNRAYPVLLAGSVAAARVMHDKAETARFAARHGLPFAATASDIAGALDLARAYGWPLIGKPRSGNASQGVVLLRSSAETERAFASRPDLIAQPYLDPPPNMDARLAPTQGGLPLFFSFPGTGKYSAQVIVGPDGSMSASSALFSTEAGGRAMTNERRDDPDLLELGQAYAGATVTEGWRGPMNVQFKRTPEGRFVAFELNGRFTGGTAARALLGFDELGEVFARFLPAVDFPSLDPVTADVVQNALASYPVPREELAALESSGTWTRAPRRAVSRRERRKS